MSCLFKKLQAIYENDFSLRAAWFTMRHLSSDITTFKTRNLRNFFWHPALAVIKRVIFREMNVYFYTRVSFVMILAVRFQKQPNGSFFGNQNKMSSFCNFLLVGSFASTKTSVSYPADNALFRKNYWNSINFIMPPPMKLWRRMMKNWASRSTKCHLQERRHNIWISSFHLGNYSSHRLMLK